MPDVKVIIASAEEAEDGIAEFWTGPELMAVTVLEDGALHLRIDPRRDGRPWLVDATSLGRGLAELNQRLAAY
jgi:hypothetical protein